MKSSRIVWIDNMKAVCIFFVMLSHLECSRGIPEEVYTPFFLTGFLFTAGYVYRPESSFPVFLEKKVRGLFVPWFVFSVGNILLSQIFSFHDHGSLREELRRNFLQIRGQGDGVWFVAALFVAFLPFYVLIRIYEGSKAKNRSLWLCLVTVLLSFLSALYLKPLPWHLEYAPQAVFFMSLGYLSRVHDLQPDLRWAGAAYLLLLLPGSLDLKMAPVMELANTYAAQIVGVFALMALCRKLPENRFRSCIGGNTLVCFALHGKVMSLLEWSAGHFRLYDLILENSVLSAVMAVALTLAMAAILLIPIRVIDHWFPFLLGRKGRKK